MRFGVSELRAAAAVASTSRGRIGLANFARQQVPKTLRQQLQRIERLPVATCPGGAALAALHRASLADLSQTPRWVINSADAQWVGRTMLNIHRRHTDTQELLHTALRTGAEVPAEALDAFYAHRLELRLLLAHVAELTLGTKPLGVLDSEVTADQVARAAIAVARTACEAHHGYSPDIVVRSTPEAPGTEHVRSLLQHCVLEVIKNALHASCSHGAPTAPPIEVEIGDRRVTVADTAGGIDPNVLWRYAPAANPTALTGYGHGLCLTRIYSRFAGGDLLISSSQGIGTVATVYWA